MWKKGSVGGNVNLYNNYGNNMEVPEKLKIELPYDPAIPLLGIYPKEMKTFSCFLNIYNSQEMETT